MIHTRKDYMAKRVSFADYYQQFAVDETYVRVQAFFGKDRLASAYKSDPNFNSIPLKEWDALCFEELRPGRGFRARLPIDRAAIAAAGDTVTRAELICIAKQAAKDIVLA